VLALTDGDTGNGKPFLVGELIILTSKRGGTKRYGAALDAEVYLPPQVLFINRFVSAKGSRQYRNDPS
jgi:hypothetical protein